MSKKQRTANDERSIVKNPTSTEYSQDKANTAKQIQENNASKKSK